MSENIKPRRWVKSNRALAKYLGCSVMKIHRLDNDSEKKFPPAYDVDGMKMRDLNEVDEWIIGHRGRDPSVSPHLAGARAKAFSILARKRARKLKDKRRPPKRSPAEAA